MAISFNGTSDKIVWNDIAAMDGLSKLTVSFFLYSDSTGTNSFPGIIQKYDENNTNGGGGWAILFDAAQNTNKILCVISNGSFQSAFTAGGSITANTFQHHLMSYDGTQGTDATKLKYYIAGSNVGLTYNASIPASMTGVTDTLKFGVNATTFAKIKLGEVAIWPGVAIRDANDIATLASSWSPDFFNSIYGVPFYADLVREVFDRNGIATAPTLTGTSVASHDLGMIYPQRRSLFGKVAVGGGSTQPPRTMHQFRMRAA